PSGQGDDQSEDQHEDQRRNASALPAGANESERASEHEDRPNGGNRPYRQRYDVSQGCCPFPNAIEHEPPLREQYGSGGRRWLPLRAQRPHHAAPDRGRLCTLGARSIACASPLPVCRMRSANSARKFELAFPRHPLERLIRIFDAILAIGAVGGEQLHDLIRTVGDHTTNRTRREVDSLADLKLVFLQRGSPALERYGLARFERCSPDSPRI